MQTVRTHANLVSGEKFLRLVAHDIVRMATQAEGLKGWLEKHSGTLRAPGRATRAYAHDIYGDDDNAVLFNTHLSLHIDRLSKLS